MRKPTKAALPRVAFGIATLGALALAPPALAREPWPPAEPPRVDLGPAPAPASPPPAAPPAAATEPPREEAHPPAVEQPPAAAPASTSAAATVTRAAPELAPRGPAYGSRDAQGFLRTPRDELVLLPVGRLELDALSLAAKDPNASENTVWLSRARLDVAGWVYSKVFFDVSADFAPAFSMRHADELLAVAPWGERAILEVGQFDAPFTLANRTPDRYLDFVDRGAAVRAFAIPENKDQGVMVHGTNQRRNYYYAAGVLNGEGPGVTGASGHADVMARGWVAPFSFGDPDALRDVRLGGSLWTGDRSRGPLFASQTTQGGFAFLDSSVWWTGGAATPLSVREQGRLEAVALELDAPFARRFGARFEWIGKRQPLSVFDESDAAHPSIVAGLRLSGFATYAELWAWVLGDSGVLGAPAAPGLGLPARLGDFAPAPPRGALMVAARVDYVDETVTTTGDATGGGLGLASVGATKLTALTAGASYWYTRRARVTVDYVFNHLAGTTPYIVGLDGPNVHELTLRVALAL
jgi:hypothetical protein